MGLSWKEKYARLGVKYDMLLASRDRLKKRFKLAAQQAVEEAEKLVAKHAADIERHAAKIGEMDKQIQILYGNNNRLGLEHRQVTDHRAAQDERIRVLTEQNRELNLKLETCRKALCDQIAIERAKALGGS